MTEEADLGLRLQTDELLWICAGIAYVGGDMATTVFAIEVLGAVEAHPVSRAIIDHTGFWVLLSVKLVFVYGVYCLSKAVIPRSEYRVWPALSLLVMGLGITLYNLTVII